MAYMCNTSNIKEMEIGRPQTVMFERGHNAQAKTYPNGTIVNLGNTMEDATIPGGATKYGRDYDHVHKVDQVKNAQAVVGKFIVVAPEINVEQYRLIDGQISKFVLEEQTTYSAYELQVLDRIEYTEDYFVDAPALAVGDFVNINAQGKFEKQAVPAGNDALRVVSILPAFYPVVMNQNPPVQNPGQVPGVPGAGMTFLPKSGLKIKLEVVK